MSKELIDIAGEKTGIVDYFDALPHGVKKQLPRPLFYLKEISGRPLLVDKSKGHNTDQLACFWFYKPVSQMFKDFE